jgi:hypothetical protein
VTPIDQTAFEERGNCLAACLATIFGVAIDELPDFLRGDWKKTLQSWSTGRGYSAAFIAPPGPGVVQFAIDLDAPLIMCGSSPRGRKHATVWDKGRPFHDPHPGRAGLTSHDYAIVFVPLSYAGGGL